MDKPESNVINLPSFQNETREYNALAAIEFAKSAKMEFCDEVSDFTFETIISTLHNFGIFMDKGRFSPNDAKLVEESVRSIVYRYYNMEHALHNIVDDIFHEEPELEELEN